MASTGDGAAVRPEQKGAPSLAAPPPEDRMNGPMIRRAIVSAAAVISIGSLLHFTWAWSGRSAVVAVFSATSESTWEHLKLAFWPALAISPIQRALYGPLPGWPPAVAIRCLLPSCLIVALAHGYRAITGGHALGVDLAIFAVAILAGELLGHAALTHAFGRKSRIGAYGLLVLSTVFFATLTFGPPDFFLFRERPSSGSES